MISDVKWEIPTPKRASTHWWWLHWWLGRDDSSRNPRSSADLWTYENYSHQWFTVERRGEISLRPTGPSRPPQLPWGRGIPVSRLKITFLQDNLNVKVPVGLIITLACLAFGFKGETQNKTAFKSPLIQPCAQIIHTVINKGGKSGEPRGFVWGGRHSGGFEVFLSILCT